MKMYNIVFSKCSRRCGKKGGTEEICSKKCICIVLGRKVVVG